MVLALVVVFFLRGAVSGWYQSGFDRVGGGAFVTMVVLGGVVAVLFSYSIRSAG